MTHVLGREINYGPYFIFILCRILYSAIGQVSERFLQRLIENVFIAIYSYATISP